MRRLKPVTQMGSTHIERRRNRRIAYFPGKYAKELTIVGLVLVALLLFAYRMNG